MVNSCCCFQAQRYTYLGSSLGHGLSCRFTGLLAELDIGNLACQLVQVVLCVVQEAVDDLIALTGALRALLLSQQLLVGLPVMCLQSPTFVQS